jgi:iron complex outermembrane receptor protein
MDVRYVYRGLCLCFLALASSMLLRAQDSTQPVELDSVVVQAFDQGSRLRYTAAAVSMIGDAALRRFGTASVVEAVNTASGVRMEERSPGSYRFSIRGSSLRSPFGVRNVKVYYNDLPLTDPSGQTYLNALGNYDYGSIEMIKGPGSSFYGAGTGGVLLISSPNEKKEYLFAEHTTGSYGLQNSYAAVTSGTEFRNRISFQHQQSSGYRTQSGLERNILNWCGLYQPNEKGTLKTTFLYSDLFYQTPGALTLNEYRNNPKSARPAAGGFPGAEGAQAAIYQQTFLAGASYTHRISEKLQNKTVAYGAFNRLRNPAIRNYGRNSEPHTGGRTVFTWKQVYQKSMLYLATGAEWQQGFSTFSTHQNKNGEADTLQIYDEVANRQASLFSQVMYTVQDWEISGGISINQYKIRFQRFLPALTAPQQRLFNNEAAPRASIMRKWNRHAIYSSVSKGFSSPTTAEAIPTGGAVNLDLNAEQGINYEFGFRGNFFKTTYVDFNAFLFRLKNTIVQRRDAGGGDYYTNAGKTRQYGIEVSLRQPLYSNGPYTRSSLWTSYTWHHFRYHDFKQVETDFSGKALPGVAPHTVAGGLDFSYHNLTAALTYYYSSKIPLNDMNDAYLENYHLVAARLAYPFHFNSRIATRLAAGVNNLLNQKYSLGADINAFGERYYNAAPRRNFYVSISFQWLKTGTVGQ